MWNTHSSCCNVFMESSQQLAFDSRQTQLTQKVGLLSGYLKALMKVRGSDVYQQEDPLEQVLFNRALNSFKPALDAAAACVRAVMVFAAGMICFSCNPNWDQFVWRGALGDVTAVNVGGESCIYVADQCGPFGRAMRQTVSLVMESALAKQPQLPLPDWSMLETRIQMCEWLRTTIAMQPIRSVTLYVVGNATQIQPRQLSRSLAEVSGSLESMQEVPRLLQLSTTGAPPTARPFPSRPLATLDPVRDGQQSGFFANARMLHDSPPADSAIAMPNIDHQEFSV